MTNCFNCIFATSKWPCGSCCRWFCDTCILDLCKHTNCSLHLVGKPCYQIILRCNNCYDSEQKKQHENFSATVIQRAWRNRNFVSI